MRPPDAERDQRDLSRFGYAQELFRSMGGFSNFAISFSIISILTGAVTLYGYGLSMGGPREMTLGWPLVAFFSLLVAASMAELASAFPTSGAMYHWSAALGGKGWAWFTASINIVGLIATLAGIDYGCAQFAEPLLGLRESARTVLLLYGGILASHALINQYGIRLVARLNDLSVTVHILGVLAIVGALLAFAPHQPPSFLAHPATVDPHASSYTWVFLLGLLQAQWTFTGFDASAHTAEETVDPRRRAPWGMLMSVAVSAVVGYALLLALTAAIQDLPGMMQAGRDGKPVPILILQAALGGRAGAAMSWLAVLAMWFCGLSAITSISRMVFSFARDGALPAWLRRIGPRHRTPYAAIWSVAVLAFAALIAGGAYSVVTSVGTVALYSAYVLPVILAVRRGRAVPYGPWSLGRWRLPVQVLAIAWTAFISVILIMPPNQTAGRSMAVVLAVLVAGYLLRARQVFEGPRWMKRLSAEHEEDAALKLATDENG